MSHSLLQVLNLWFITTFLSQFVSCVPNFIVVKLPYSVVDTRIYLFKRGENHLLILYFSARVKEQVWILVINEFTS